MNDSLVKDGNREVRISELAAIGTKTGGVMPQPAITWTPDDTEHYLSACPLPVDFCWPRSNRAENGSLVRGGLAPVVPGCKICMGFGFWLRTTPGFPGLFEEVHEILLAVGAELPTRERLADLIQRVRPR